MDREVRAFFYAVIGMAIGMTLGLSLAVVLA